MQLFIAKQELNSIQQILLQNKTKYPNLKGSSRLLNLKGSVVPFKSYMIAIAGQ